MRVIHSGATNNNNECQSSMRFNFNEGYRMNAIHSNGDNNLLIEENGVNVNNNPLRNAS